jgi:hypothetical protein
MSSRQGARRANLPVIDLGELLGIPRPPPGSNVLREAVQEQQSTESDSRRAGAEGEEEEKEANQDDSNGQEPNRNNAEDSSGTTHEENTEAEGSRKISPNNGDIEESNWKRRADGSPSEEADAKRPANSSDTARAAPSSIGPLLSQPTALNVELSSSVMGNESEACLSRFALSSTALSELIVGGPRPLEPAMAGPYQAVPSAICFMPPSHSQTNKSRLALETARNQLLLSIRRRRHHSLASIESNDEQDKRKKEEHKRILN